MNTPFGNSITTAEHAIALMMALAREIPAADRSTQAGKWEKSRFVGVELYAKAEWENPGGSIKDRPALNMILEAERSGKLTHGKTLIDATSGNTGIAYAKFITN